MRHTVLSSNGRITIPAELRKRLRLKPGARLYWSERNGRLVLVPTKQLLKGIRGLLKPGPSEPSMFEALFEERKRARMRENS